MRDGATVAVIRKAVIGTAAFYAAVALSWPAHSAQTSENSSVLIVDSSNSMWSQIRGRGRFDITRSVLSRNFSTYSGRFDLGIIAYGNRSKTSCSDIQTIMPIGRIEPRKYSRAVRRLTPKGKTPISRALNAAMKVTKSGSPPDNIVLLSDGVDNCGPNPCATAAALNSLHANLRVHVIALSVPPKQQSRLRCIAENTGGTFVAARNQPGLASATETIFDLIAEQNEQMLARRLMAMTETAYSSSDAETDALNTQTLTALNTDTSGQQTRAESSAASALRIPIPRSNPRTVAQQGSAPNVQIAESVGEPQPFIPTTAISRDGTIPELVTMPDIAATPEMWVAPEIVAATKILPAPEAARTSADNDTQENAKAVEDTEAQEVTAALEVAAAPGIASAPAPAIKTTSEAVTALEVTAAPDPSAPPRVFATPVLPGTVNNGAAPKDTPAPGSEITLTTAGTPDLAETVKIAGAPKTTSALKATDTPKATTTKAVAVAAKAPVTLEVAKAPGVTKTPDTSVTPDTLTAPKVAATPEVKTPPKPASVPTSPAIVKLVPIKPVPAKPVTVAAKAAPAPAPATTGAISADDSTGIKPPAKINLGNRPIPRLPDEVRPAFLINEEPTDAGDEGLRLRGQITSATATITRPIDWAAYKVEDAKADRWRKIASVETAEATISLPPGQYVVRASYGAARAAKVLVVKPGKRIDATFILNAGGLRVLPGLAFLDTPKGISAKHWVFGASANDKGKRRLFAQSTAIGEVVRLNSGTYTLVSRFGSANAVVETNITIRPGTLTEVEINHKVGIVSFRLSKPPKNASDDKAVKWQLVDASGNIIVRADGKEMTQILAPGSYRIMVEHQGKSYTSEFMVEIGETKAVEIATK